MSYAWILAKQSTLKLSGLFIKCGNKFWDKKPEDFWFKKNEEYQVLYLKNFLCVIHINLSKMKLNKNQKRISFGLKGLNFNNLRWNQRPRNEVHPRTLKGFNPFRVVNTLLYLHRGFHPRLLKFSHFVAILRYKTRCS